MSNFPFILINHVFEYSANQFHITLANGLNCIAFRDARLYKISPEHWVFYHVPFEPHTYNFPPLVYTC